MSLSELQYDLSEETYHRDDVAGPSLSAHSAMVLDRQSPAHCYDQHPQLGGKGPAHKATYDAGNLCHRLILGEGGDIVIVQADDWRTKAAQEKRNAARAEGKIPVLEKDHEMASVASAAILLKLDDFGIRLIGKSEVSAFWEEKTEDGSSVQCRGRMDHLALSAVSASILDLKSCRSAHPDACAQHVDAYGYDIQRAAYVSALETIRPECAGRVEYTIVFAEIAPPFVVTPVRLSGEFAALGKRRWMRAVETWERCLRAGDWPGYVADIRTIDPPPWALQKDIVRDDEEGGDHG